MLTIKRKVQELYFCKMYSPEKGSAGRAVEERDNEDGCGFRMRDLENRRK
jgi:hypothetical protein